MPKEWPDEMFAKLCYKTPDSRMLEVAVLQADDSLVLHWCPFDPADSQQESDVHSTTISSAGYFSDSQNGAEAYIKGQLKELIEKFAPGIDLILQVLLPQKRKSPTQSISSRRYALMPVCWSGCVAHRCLLHATPHDSQHPEMMHPSSLFLLFAPECS